MTTARRGTKENPPLNSYNASQGFRSTLGHLVQNLGASQRSSGSNYHEKPMDTTKRNYHTVQHRSSRHSADAEPRAHRQSRSDHHQSSKPVRCVVYEDYDETSHRRSRNTTRTFNVVVDTKGHRRGNRHADQEEYVLVVQEKDPEGRERDSVRGDGEHRKRRSTRTKCGDCRAHREETSEADEQDTSSAKSSSSKHSRRPRTMKSDAQPDLKRRDSPRELWSEHKAAEITIVDPESDQERDQPHLQARPISLSEFYENKSLKMPISCAAGAGSMSSKIEKAQDHSRRCSAGRPHASSARYHDRLSRSVNDDIQVRHEPKVRYFQPHYHGPTSQKDCESEAETRLGEVLSEGSVISIRVGEVSTIKHI